jgi:hypothetical protein
MHFFFGLTATMLGAAARAQLLMWLTRKAHSWMVAIGAGEISISKP